MAYVPGFEYDLFISYASDDFDELKQLIEDIRTYLRRELGKEFSSERGIFLDRQELNLTPIQWKQKLQNSAKSAAILVPVITPSWASSEYCAKEWEWFREEHPLNWQAGTEAIFRVCPIRWSPLDSEMLQQIPREIRSAQEQRSLQVQDLGTTIANGLRLMRRSRQTVYVGECEHEIRRQVRDEMNRMGFRVMPEAMTAYEDDQFVQQLLGKAKAAVHFVGSQYRQRAIDAIRWSREDCQSATVVYEIPGVDLSAEELVACRSEFVSMGFVSAHPNTSTGMA
jgi:TIR domain-containing protein